MFTKKVIVNIVTYVGLCIYIHIIYYVYIMLYRIFSLDVCCLLLGRECIYARTQDGGIFRLARSSQGSN